MRLVLFLLVSAQGCQNSSKKFEFLEETSKEFRSKKKSPTNVEKEEKKTECFEGILTQKLNFYFDLKCMFSNRVQQRNNAL